MTTWEGPSPGGAWTAETPAQWAPVLGRASLGPLPPASVRQSLSLGSAEHAMLCGLLGRVGLSESLLFSSPAPVGSTVPAVRFPPGRRVSPVQPGRRVQSEPTALSVVVSTHPVYPTSPTACPGHPHRQDPVTPYTRTEPGTTQARGVTATFVQSDRLDRGGAACFRSLNASF